MSKKLLTSFALVIFGLFISCAKMDAVKSTSNDPGTNSVETLVHDKDSLEQRMEESQAGRSQINVNVQAESTQEGRTQPSENDNYSDGQYSLVSEPGYIGVNSDDQKNITVTKQDNEKYWKTDTSNDIYIDTNLIAGDEISDETKSIYSILVQDAAISIRSGENPQRLYIAELKRINLLLSPTEFKDAFEKHIDAWERDSDDEIKSTMDEVLKISLKYAVRMRK